MTAGLDEFSPSLGYGTVGHRHFGAYVECVGVSFTCAEALFEDTHPDGATAVRVRAGLAVLSMTEAMARTSDDIPRGPVRKVNCTNNYQPQVTTRPQPGNR